MIEKYLRWFNVLIFLLLIISLMANIMIGRILSVAVEKSMQHDSTMIKNQQTIISKIDSLINKK